MQYFTQHVNILPSIRSDHSLLKLTLKLEDEEKRVRGIWKLNTSLLLDDNYISHMKSTILKAIEDSKHLQNSFQTWDYIKCMIRTESITYSINRSKRDKNMLKQLSDRLSVLEEIVSSTPTTDDVDEYDLIKKQIEEIYKEKAFGAIIRSRCQMLEEYERPTKYFLNLEKTKQNVKHIRTLVNDGHKISCSDEILELEKKYFERLYSESDVNSNTDVYLDTYLNNINIPKISEESQQICDKTIDFDEVCKAVDALANNKSPGMDGIPVEFYKKFWNQIGEYVYGSFIQAFDKGELSDSQRKGVINLIPKKDKDLTNLKSWRPLSILNTDYKIIAKVLSNRLKTGLMDIINPDQIGYMQNRYCGENVNLIADVIDYCKCKNASCIILLADVEKAFDTVKWSFIKKLLHKYGFGSNFQRWISVLYNQTESCVTNNGYLSPYFKLGRGIRQGCPVSALLFLLVAEVVAIVLREAKNVKGLYVKQTCIKLLFLKDTISVKYAICIFEEFYRYAGLKLNKSKTLAFIIENDTKINPDTSIGIVWTKNPFKTLGIWFATNSTETQALNITEKLKVIQNILKLWQPRCLTLIGKITVIKSLIIPHILQLASVVSFSDKLISKLDKLLQNFIWNNRKPLVSKNILIQWPEYGGLKMVSVKHVVLPAKIMWFK